jgi:hypothetical protein
MKKLHCNYSYSCSADWNDLQSTAAAGIKYCDHCRQEVYRARSEADFQRLAREGKCVAFEIDGTDYLGTPDGTANYSD